MNDSEKRAQVREEIIHILNKNGPSLSEIAEEIIRRLDSIGVCIKSDDQLGMSNRELVAFRIYCSGQKDDIVGAANWEKLPLAIRRMYLDVAQRLEDEGFARIVGLKGG